MSTTLKSLIEKQAQIRKEMQEHGKTALKDAFKVFFDENPTCEAIRWRQYTPYFNDGEACTFSIREAYVRMRGADEDDDSGDYDDGFDNYSSYYAEKGRYNNLSQEQIEAWKKAGNDADELVGCDKDLFQMTFGDHVKVTATREGFEVEEYDHD